MTSQVEDDTESELGELPLFNVEASPVTAMVKQVEAFTHLAEEARRHHNMESLCSALQYLIECPFVGTPRRVTPNRTSTNRENKVTSSEPESETETAVASIAQMRALLNKWRRKCGKTRQESEHVNRLEKFFKELQYQRRLARYFVQRIYAPLYKKFFDLNVLTASLDGGDSGIAVPSEDNDPTAFFLTECDIPDNVSPITMPEKFEEVVNHLTNLHERWRHLLKEDAVFSEVEFEPSSLAHVEALLENVKNPSVCLSLRLLPDLFDKCAAAASLAMQWMNISEDLSPINSKNEKQQDSFSEQLLKDLRRELSKKESEIRRGEHSLNIYEQELEQLNEREKRVLTLCENCEQLETHREQIGEEYQEKVESRVKAMEELENTIQGSQRYRELAGKLKEFEKVINDQYGELKLVEYALNIAADDYDLHMSVQPSFYAYSRTTRDKIERTQRAMEKNRKDKEHLQRQYERVKNQVEQMRLVTEEATPDSSPTKEEGRPATNATYTKFRIDDRYSDKAQNSDNSPPSGTDGEVESGHEADSEVSEKTPRPLKPSGGEFSRPRARATAFPVWPVHSGPGKLVNHSAPLSKEPPSL